MPSPSESWYLIRVLIRALVLGCWNLVLNSLLLWRCLHNCQNCYYIRVPISFMFNHIYIYYLKHVQRLPILGVDLSDWFSGKASSIVDDIFYHTAKVGLCVKSPQFSLGILKRFYYVVLIRTLFKTSKNY
jgi:hypothetical protein